MANFTANIVTLLGNKIVVSTASGQLYCHKATYAIPAHRDAHYDQVLGKILKGGIKFNTVNWTKVASLNTVPMTPLTATQQSAPATQPKACHCERCNGTGNAATTIKGAENLDAGKCFACRGTGRMTPADTQRQQDYIARRKARAVAVAARIEAKRITKEQAA